MPIEVECFVCARTYRVPENLAGKRIKCKGCGDRLDVPASDSAEEVAEEWDEAPAPRRSRSSRRPASSRKSSSGPPVALLAGGGALGLVVLVGLAWTFLGRNPPAVVPSPPATPAPASIAANSTPSSPGAPVPPQPPAAAPAATPPVPSPVPTEADLAAAKKLVDAELAKSSGPGFASAEKTSRAALVPVTDWNVQPDPPKDVSLPEPPKSLKAVPAARSPSDHFIGFPSVPSPFLALYFEGRSSNGTVEAWNLATGQKTGTVPFNDYGIDHLTPSPDGKFVALTTVSGTKLSLLDVTKKKLIGTLAVEENGKAAHIATLGFTKPDRLVGLCNIGTCIKIWEVPSGKLLRSVPYAKNFLGSTAGSFSPGGRYVAALDEFLLRDIGVYDAETGTRVGLIPAPKAKGSVPELEGVAFSADGTELVVLYHERTYGADARDASRIVVFKLADGSVSDDFDIEPSLPKQLGVSAHLFSLVPYPGGRYWLAHGRAVIDRESRALVQSYPTALAGRENALRHPFGKDWTIAVNFSKSDCRLATETLDPAVMAQAASAADTGALAADIGLPPLTPSDYAEATLSRGSDGWNYTPDPAPDFKPSGKAIPIPVKVGEPFALHVAGGRVALALGMGETQQRQISEFMKQLKSESQHSLALDLYDPRFEGTEIAVHDANTGAPVSRWNVTGSMALQGLSPDGQLALLRLHKGDGRLDLFSTSDGKHLVGWRPYRSAAESSRALIAAEVLGDNRVATINAGGQDLVVWDTKPLKPLYRIERAETVIASPGGKSFLIAVNPVIDPPFLAMFDAATGEGQGRIAGIPCNTLAWHPDGKRLVAASRAEGGARLDFIDLDEGVATTELSVPFEADTLAWVGDHHLLVNSSLLLDTELKAVVWSYDPIRTVVAPTAPNSQLWFAAAAGRNASVRHLELPDPALQKKLNPADLAKSALLRPGDALAVQLNVAADSELADLGKRIQADIDAAVSRSGFKAAPDAGVQLRVTASVQALGTAGVSQLGQLAASETVTVKEATVLVELVSGGKTLWQARRVARTADSFSIFRREPGESSQQALDRLLRGKATPLADSLQLPAYVIGQDGKGLGTSPLASLKD
jgi:WD40 repeat protein